MEIIANQESSKLEGRGTAHPPRYIGPSNGVSERSTAYGPICVPTINPVSPNPLSAHAGRTPPAGGVPLQDERREHKKSQRPTFRFSATAYISIFNHTRKVFVVKTKTILHCTGLMKHHLDNRRADHLKSAFPH